MVKTHICRAMLEKQKRTYQRCIYLESTSLIQQYLKLQTLYISGISKSCLEGKLIGKDKQTKRQRGVCIYDPDLLYQRLIGPRKAALWEEKYLMLSVQRTLKRNSVSFKCNDMKVAQDFDLLLPVVIIIIMPALL